MIALPAHMEGRVRFSHLKTLGLKSPAHLFAGSDLAATPAIERGSAVNSLVLGTGPRVVGYPGKTRNGKEWEAFATENADALILSRTDYEHAIGMAAALKAHTYAMRALDGVREETIHWEFSGLPCRSTPDAYKPKAFVTDLKCSFTSHPERFMSHALRMCYHGQLDWYGEALRRARGFDPLQHYIVTVEDKAPYVVQVFRLSARTLEAGSRMWRLWFERLKTCAESGVWPGYCEAVTEIDVPEDAEIRYANEEET